MENHLLEVKGVDVLYGDVQAVWDLSIHVDDGAIVALVGANGAGKTTLLKTISGIIRAKRGEILFSGKSLTKIRPQEVVDIGVSHVPEGRRLFPYMTVKENLILGAYPGDAWKDKRKSMEMIMGLFPILKERRFSGLDSQGRQKNNRIENHVTSKLKARHVNIFSI